MGVAASSSVAPRAAAGALQVDVFQPGARAALTTQPGRQLPDVRVWGHGRGFAPARCYKWLGEALGGWEGPKTGQCII